ncbi:hypothetical protein GIB67_032853, partial [Kingdonia uniflora]
DIGVSSAPTFTGSGHEANKRAGQCSNIENANTSRKSSSQVDAHNGITGNKIPDQFVRKYEVITASSYAKTAIDSIWKHPWKCIQQMKHIKNLKSQAEELCCSFTYKEGNKETNFSPKI